MQPLVQYRDANGKRIEGLYPASDTVYNLHFAGAGTDTVTVPDNARFAMFKATANFAAKIGGTATYPASKVTDGTASELNPAGRFVAAGDTIGIAVSGAAEVTIAFYS